MYKKLEQYGVALLRIAMGVTFIAHGLLLKVMEYTIGGTVDYFVSIGYAPVLAYLVIFGEIAGGILLLLGWQVRLVSLLLLPIMMGATFEHFGNGWLFSNPNGGWEFPAFWSAALIAQHLMGAGAISFDRKRSTFGGFDVSRAEVVSL